VAADGDDAVRAYTCRFKQLVGGCRENYTDYTVEIIQFAQCIIRQFAGREQAVVKLLRDGFAVRGYQTGSARGKSTSTVSMPSMLVPDIRPM
jgi:hypothetical protein